MWIKVQHIPHLTKQVHAQMLHVWLCSLHFRCWLRPSAQLHGPGTGSHTCAHHQPPSVMNVQATKPMPIIHSCPDTKRVRLCIDRFPIVFSLPALDFSNPDPFDLASSPESAKLTCGPHEPLLSQWLETHTLLYDSSRVPSLFLLFAFYLFPFFFWRLTLALFNIELVLAMIIGQRWHPTCSPTPKCHTPLLSRLPCVCICSKALPKDFAYTLASRTATLYRAVL